MYLHAILSILMLFMEINIANSTNIVNSKKVYSSNR